MADKLKVTPILDKENICSIRLKGGAEKYLSTEVIKSFGIWEYLDVSNVEYYFMKIFGDNCIIILSCSEFQDSYTIIWDYVQDKIVHLTKTPFAFSSIIWKNQVINMYLVSFWGHPAELCYSFAPLDFIDSKYEPDLIQLHISANDVDNDFNNCGISIENDSIIFHAGEQKEVVTLDF